MGGGVGSNEKRCFCLKDTDGVRDRVAKNIRPSYFQACAHNTRTMPDCAHAPWRGACLEKKPVPRARGGGAANPTRRVLLQASRGSEPGRPRANNQHAHLGSVQRFHHPIPYPDLEIGLGWIKVVVCRYITMCTHPSTLIYCIE